MAPHNKPLLAGRKQASSANADRAPLPAEYRDHGNLPTVVVILPPELDGGGTIEMRKFTTRDYFALRTRSLTDQQLMELTLDAIRVYLPGKDVMDLAPTEVMDIMNSWVEAKVKELVPPTSA